MSAVIYTFPFCPEVFLERVGGIVIPLGQAIHGDLPHHHRDEGVDSDQHVIHIRIVGKYKRKGEVEAEDDTGVGNQEL